MHCKGLLNKNMKILKILITLTIITIVFSFGVTVMAQEAESTGLDLTGKLTNVAKNAQFQEADSRSIATTIGGVIKALLSLLGVIFMAYIIYGGYLWMTAAGNEEKLSKAKAIIRGSITGIIIVFLAYAITHFVIVKVGQATGYRATSGTAGE